MPRSAIKLLGEKFSEFYTETEPREYLRMLLSKYPDTATDRQREAIGYLADGSAETYRDVARLMGVSESVAGQFCKDALRKLCNMNRRYMSPSEREEINLKRTMQRYEKFRDYTFRIDWTASEPYDPECEMLDIRLTADGKEYVANFTTPRFVESMLQKNRETGELGGGAYFGMPHNVVFVDVLTEDNITRAIDAVIANREFDAYFKEDLSKLPNEDKYPRAIDAIIAGRPFNF